MRGAAVWSRVRAYPELWVLLVLAAVGWPLRQVLGGLVTPGSQPGTMATLPLALVGLALFMLPGAALLCIVGDDETWWERLALAFVCSLALVGLISQTAIFLRTNIQFVLWGFLILSATLLAGAVLRCALAPGEPRSRSGQDRTPFWLWLILLAMVAGTIFYQLNSPTDQDQMDAGAYIQNMLADEHMMVQEPKLGAGVPVSPRFDFSAWLVDQALMSRLTGQNPWDQFQVLRLPLMLLTLAALYRMARAVTGRRDTAAVVTVVWIFYLLTTNEGTVAGYETVVRPDLDKDVAGFIVLPVALSLVMDQFNQHRRRDWLWLLMAATASGLTHPIGVVLIGLSLIGFGVSELLLGHSLATVGRLAFTVIILTVALTPAVYSLIRLSGGGDLGIVATDLADTRDAHLAAQLRLAFYAERLWVYQDGSFTLHPRLILQGLHLPALLGLPILFFAQLRHRGARLLFGMVVVICAVSLFAPAVQLLGRLITPWLVFRINWPVSIASAVAVGWGIWSVLRRLSSGATRAPAPGAAARAAGSARRRRGTPSLAPAGSDDPRRAVGNGTPAPAGSDDPRRAIVSGVGAVLRALVGIALWAAAVYLAYPHAQESFRLLSDARIDTDYNLCVSADPILRPFRELTSSDTIVLAESGINMCLGAYAPYANVMEFRSTNTVRSYMGMGLGDEGWRRLFDSLYYNNAEFADSRLMEVIEHWRAEYLIVRLDHPLEEQIRHLPAMFQPVSTAAERTIYRIVAPDPGAPIVAANSHLTAQEFPEAIAAFVEILRTGDADARYLAAIGLGRAYLQVNRRDEALAAWQSAGQIVPAGHAFALQGELYALLGKGEQALQAYQQASTLEPWNSLLVSRVGDLGYALGRTDLAEESYKTAAVLVKPQGTSAYYRSLGSSWMNVRAYPQAIAAFREAVALSDSQDNNRKLGQAYQGAARWDEAEAAFGHMIQLDRWDSRGQVAMAGLLEAQEKHQEALEKYRSALRLNPLAPGAYAAFANIVRSQQGVPAAVAALKELLGYRELSLGDAHLAMAGLRSALGQPGIALSEVQLAIDWDEENPAYYDSYAAGQLALGSEQEAAATYLKTLGMNYLDAAAYQGLGQVALARGDLGTATGHALQAAVAAPYSSSFRQALGGMYEQLDRDADALVQYQAAVAIDPASTSPLLALGGYWQRQADYSQAEQIYGRAAALLPQYPDANVLLSQAGLAQSLGDLVAAVQLYAQAADLSPGFGLMRVSLGQAQAQAGDRRSAEGQFRAGMEVDPGFLRAYTALGSLYEVQGQWDLAERVYITATQVLTTSPQGAVSRGLLAEKRGKTRRPWPCSNRPPRSSPLPAPPRRRWATSGLPKGASRPPRTRTARRSISAQLPSGTTPP